MYITYCVKCNKFYCTNRISHYCRKCSSVIVNVPISYEEFTKQSANERYRLAFELTKQKGK